MSKIIEATFLTSAKNLATSPSPISSEIVILGRSNVGKSSLINAIFGKNIAKSSATPGKTKLINFFTSIWQDEMLSDNIPLTMIDLPGFGYAKVSKEMKKDWEENLLSFLSRRDSIKLFLCLKDSRHIDLAIDTELFNMLHAIKKGDQEILTIYTKCDKISQNDLAKIKLKYKDAILTSVEFNTKIKNKITSMVELRKIILHKSLGIQ